jgi:hypothetical protein
MDRLKNITYVCSLINKQIYKQYQFIKQRMKKVFEVYDFPENREIAEFLTPGERNEIAAKTGYCSYYVWLWSKGRRRSDRITRVAKNIRNRKPVIERIHRLNKNER